MTDLKKIKEKAEATKCPVHGHPPIITIENDDLSLKACCEEFGKRIQEYIKNEILYDWISGLSLSINGKEIARIGEKTIPSTQISRPAIISKAMDFMDQSDDQGAKTILEDFIENQDHKNYASLAEAHSLLMAIFTRSLDPSVHSIGAANHHAKMALVFGDKTGNAATTLAEHLERRGSYYQAIELCKLVIGPGFKFKSGIPAKKHLFGERLERLQSKLGKALDSQDDKLFTDEERDLIRRNSMI